MSNRTPRSDGTVVVVGGGLSGLVTANLLADRQLGAIVLEQRGRLGGRASSEERDGFVLNQGPHALYVGGAAARTLARLGIPLPGSSPSLRHAAAARGGTLHRLPVGAVALARTGLLDRAGKVELGGWLARIARAAPGPLAGTSVEEWIAATLRGEDAGRVAAALVRVATYTADLDRLSADAGLLQLRQSIRSGVRYLDGGWQTLVDGLAERARRRGVTFRRGVAVTSVGAEAGRWVAQTGDGREVPGDAIVLCSGTPARAARLLGDRADGASWRTGEAAEVAVLDIGLGRLPEPRRRFALGLDEPLYFSVHAPPARLAEPGDALAVVAAYVPRAAPESGGRGQLEAFASLLQPGWAETARLTRYLRRMTAIAAIPSPEHGGLAGRAPVALPRSPGVFLAGDWVGPEGLLADAAVASAARAVEAICNRCPAPTA